MKDSEIKYKDVIVINIEPKIIGKIRFSSYTDTLVGITPDRFVEKEFRITTDDIFWTPWMILNDHNLSATGYHISENSIHIQVRYTRLGSDEFGVIEFRNINFDGEREDTQYVAPTLYSSIFSNIINQNILKTFETNLFKKLYYRGILPSYITRAENSDKTEDRDFIDLFFSIARFFSLIICFSKRFENFINDFELMREQVRQYGLYFDEKNINLDDLKYLTSNLYDEVRKRGTEMIFSKKGEIEPNGSIIPIDGEFLRLIRYKKDDELLYEKIPIDKMGWCLGKSSPMYKGTCQSEHLNKTGENTQDFQNLDNFHISKKEGANAQLPSTAVIGESDEKKVLILHVYGDSKIGLGRVDDGDVITDKIYAIDSSIDYEITFDFKFRKNNLPLSQLKFGVEGFDVNKNKLNDSFILPNGNNISENFFNLPNYYCIPDQWYSTRGIIFSYSSKNLEKNNINIGRSGKEGSNLYFNNSFVKYILPKITLEGFFGGGDIDGAVVEIWNYKIRPLVRGANILPLKNGAENSHSLGFIQSSNIFYSYLRNNNNGFNRNQIYEIVDKYLLPYNLTNMLVFIGNEESDYKINI